MNKKSKRKNNLRSSIILLLILLLLLISSTYAWFTANQTVTISTLDVYIDAKNGLQISTDASTWKSLITKDDITTKGYAGNTNLVPTQMEPVSTVGSINAGNMSMYYGTVAANEDNGGAYELTAVQATDDQGKYIVFDMFLKVDTQTNLNLTEASYVKMKTGSTDKGIKQASRVAFCIEGNKPAGTPVGDITSMAGANDSLVYIWEPNSNLHTAAAVSHADDTYDIITTADGTAAPINNYGINQIITTGMPLKSTNGPAVDGTYFTLRTPDYVTKADDTGAYSDPAPTPIFTLDPGITKVRTYMWIEGQDVDCENTASGTDITFNVQFEVAE